MHGIGRIYFLQNGYSLNKIGECDIPATIIDRYKIFPRIMMGVVTLLTYQAVHWFMTIPHDQVNMYNTSLVSVCMGALTGSFGMWLNKETKTDRGN